MSVPGAGGGGGINLPPLVQQIQIKTGIDGKASAQIGQISQAIGQANAAVGGMGTSWNGMSGTINRSIPTWRSAGDAMRMTGSLLMYQVAMPLKAVGTAAIKASMDFEKSMKHIQGLVGMTGKQVDAMSTKVLNMAGDVGKAPGELADALYYITSAGITDASAALDTLNVSARAASAGLGTTQDVANLSTSVMNAYAPGLYNASVATDALVAAVREGKAEASEFAPAMGKVIPVAASFGVKFQDVAASIAALTRQGAPAGTAAIQLRQILASLLDPTQKATDQLSEYGLSAVKLRETIQQKGLLAGLEELRGAFGDNASELSQVFGNIRPLQAVMALIGPSFEQNAEIFRELGASAGDADKAFEVASNTLGFKLNQASAEAKVALVKIGDAISPLIKGFAEIARVASQVFGFIAEMPGVVKTAAVLGGLAIGITAIIRSYASFIRMTAYTTTAIQGMTNGLYDQTTGLVTNIHTGQTYSATMAGMSAATSGAGAAVGGAASAVNGLTGAQAGAIGPTIALRNASIMNASAQIAASNGIWFNVRAMMAARIGATGAAVSISRLGIVTQYTAVTLKAMAASVKLTFASMMTTMLPTLVMFTAAYAAFKLVKVAISNANKEVKNSYTEINKLTDSLSNFRVAPITVGVDVQYEVAGQKTKTESGSQTRLFEDFLFGKNEEGEISDQGKIIKKEIDSYAEQVKSGFLSGAEKIKTAAGFVQMFGGDITTLGSATDYFAARFGINRQELSDFVSKSSTDAKSIFENNFVRFSKDIAESSAHAARTGQYGYIPGDLIASGFDSVNEYFKSVVAVFGKGSSALDNIGTDIKTTASGIVDPLKNALSSGGGSAEQFVAGLDSVYEAAFNASKSTDFAEKATLKYAKAAFKASDMSAKGATVAELLSNNSDVLNGSIMNLSKGVENVTGKTNAANISNKELIDTFNNNFRPVAQSTARDIQGVADVVDSLKESFDGGLNPFVNDAATIMDAYTEALKNAKKGQDALFGSQIALIDAQANYGTAFTTALTDIKAANGDIASGSEASLKAQKSLADLYKSVMEVGNAVYANTTGTAEERQSAAIAAVNDYYDAYIKELKSKAGLSQAAIDEFASVRLGKRLTVGGEQIVANADFMGLTFGQDEVTPETTGAGKAGQDTAQGFVEGLLSKKDSVEQASIELAKQHVSSIKKELAIKSPSRVMYEIGKQAAQGYVHGVRDEFTFTSKSAIDAARNSVKQIKTATFREFEGFNIGQKPKNGENDGNNPTVMPGGDILAGRYEKAQKDAARQDALAKAIKLQGKKTASTIYDTVATNLAGADAARIFKKSGEKGLQDYAEGVLAAQGKVKNNITKLVKAIVGEVNDKLSTFTSVISAQLNLSSAENDLKKFMVNSTPEMLAASVAAATRAVNQSQMKYGAGQGTEVTMYERSRIAAAKTASEQAQRDYRLGKISYADMVDAQTEYANVQAAASEASKENADATNNLSDAQYQQKNSSILLASEQLKVVSAQNELTTAYINAKSAGSDLKDMLAGLATQAGISTDLIFKSFDNLVTKSAGSLGISASLQTLIAGASKEADNASITNAPTAPVETAQTKFQKMQAIHKLPTVKPARPKKGDRYRNSLGVSFIWDGNSWNRTPGYAKGGNMTPGRLAMVGENGPELVRPKSAMNVTPFSVLERYARTIAHGGEYRGKSENERNINITVNNPVPERASDSIARRMQNMSTLGLFG